MKKSNKFCIALSVAACLCAGVAVGAQYSAKDAAPITASADAQTYEATEIKMFDKGSIRTVGNAGIRFSTFIGDDYLTNNTAQDSQNPIVEIGTLFLPATALNGEETELVVGGKYTSHRVEPAVAKCTNLDMLVLTEMDGYDNGKFFNAVLNLTDLNGVNRAAFYNTDIVARTYVKRYDGTIEYVANTASRAPAYVAGVLLEDPDNADVQIYNDYVEYVDVDFTNATYNVGQDQTITVTANSNVNNLPVTYTASKGAFEGNVYDPAGKGTVTLTASVAGGKKTATATLNVIGNERTFYSNYFTPTDDFAFTASNVSEVKVDKGDGEGFQALTINEDWALSTDGITVSKEVFGEVPESTLKLISTDGNAEVKVKTYFADTTNLGDGELGMEVFGDIQGADNIVHDVENGQVTLRSTAVGANAFTRIALHPDYLRAMYANPTMNTLTMRVQFTNVTAGNYGIPGAKAEGGHGTTTTSIDLDKPKSVGLNRAAFDAIEKDGDLTMYNFGVSVGTQFFQEGQEVTATIDWIGVAPQDTNNAAANQLYADVPLIAKTGLPIYTNTQKDLTLLTFDNNFLATHTRNKDVAVLDGAKVNWTLKTGTVIGFKTDFDGARERWYGTTKAILDDNQYINVDTHTEETYKYPFTIGEKDVITSIKIGNKKLDVATVFDGSGITVDMADLQRGHNALEIIVRRTYAASSWLNTAVDTYYRSLCVVNNSDYWSAMTFEDGNINPFLSIVGYGSYSVAEASEVVLSTAVDYATVAADQVYDMSAEGKGDVTVKQNNTKVLKVTTSTTAGSNLRLYVPKKYYEARIAALAAAIAKSGTNSGGTTCMKMAAIKLASNSTWLSWNTYVEGVTDPFYTAGNSGAQGDLTSCLRSIGGDNPFTNNPDADYFYVELIAPGTSAYTIMIDNILVANWEATMEKSYYNIIK